MRALIPVLCMLTLASGPAVARGPFERNALAVSGRVLDVVVEDFTGNGQADVLVVHVDGLTPDEVRKLSLFIGPADRRPGFRPDHSIVVPGQTVAFDAAEVDLTPGFDLLLLDGQGVLQLPVGESGFGRPKRLVAAPNLATTPQPDHLPRFRFALELDEDKPRVLFLPVYGGVRIFPEVLSGGSADSDLLRVAHRNNYGADPGSNRGKRNLSFQITTVIPEVAVGDHDGDGVNDLFFLWEDELEVFSRNASGHFQPEHAAYYDLDIETRKEKEERNAWVQPQLDDLQGDGIADLVLMKVAGNMMDMRSTVHVYPGRKGGGYGPQPSQVMQREDFTPAVMFADADGDGAKDLVVASLEIGIGAALEVLTKRRITVEFNLHLNNGGQFPKKPSTTIEVPFVLNITGGGDIRSAPPVFGRDFDGDGISDLLHGAGANALVIHRGTREDDELFEDHFRVRLKAPTSPWMRVTEGERPSVVLFFRNRTDMKGKLFWFRNRHAW